MVTDTSMALHEMLRWTYPKQEGRVAEHDAETPEWMQQYPPEYEAARRAGVKAYRLWRPGTTAAREEFAAVARMWLATNGRDPAAVDEPGMTIEPRDDGGMGWCLHIEPHRYAELFGEEQEVFWGCGSRPPREE